ADAARTDSLADTKSTRSNSAALAGLGFGVPMSCTNVSQGETRSMNVDASNASPLMTSHSEGRVPATGRRTSARTRWPRASKSGIRRLPRYPVPPVTKTYRVDARDRPVSALATLESGTDMSVNLTITEWLGRQRLRTSAYSRC